MNRLIKRTVLNTKPITVEYEITNYGKKIAPIIDEIANWGNRVQRCALL
ncbi:winged helix-turn-helix transcriptional regulator [Elizabethkingia anophelis]|nr:winged helix-turn-helix transcriptional regulator [Elizabethkingia anophelis]MCT4062929.1 winged helix-turn-helix transcriptional regulator [Elizabethkingia anophelis]MCT4109220.1 winged helix-turn-helix transcriptional regulator [Elizabethkingia anophelis]